MHKILQSVPPQHPTAFLIFNENCCQQTQWTLSKLHSVSPDDCDDCGSHSSISSGFALFFIKCTCFCRPQHHKAGTEEAEEEDKSKLQNGTKKVILKVHC